MHYMVVTKQGAGDQQFVSYEQFQATADSKWLTVRVTA